MSTASEITPTDPKVLRVIEAGRSRNIEVRPVTFPAETRTAADAARAVGCEVGQIVKSLIFQAQGRPMLLLVSGANRVDLVKGAAAAGVDRLEKADADEARAATGFSIGATPSVRARARDPGANGRRLVGLRRGLGRRGPAGHRLSCGAGSASRRNSRPRRRPQAVLVVLGFVRGRPCGGGPATESAAVSPSRCRR